MKGKNMREDLKNDIGILLLRLTAGGLMLTHGWPKLMKLFAGAPYKFADPLGVGVLASLILVVFSEVICALMVTIGYKIKWASVPLVLTMVVAAFVIHGPDPFKRKEKAIMYLIMYIALFFTGSGRLSLDKILKK